MVILQLTNYHGAYILKYDDLFQSSSIYFDVAFCLKKRLCNYHTYMFLLFRIRFVVAFISIIPGNSISFSAIKALSWAYLSLLTLRPPSDIPNVSNYLIIVSLYNLNRLSDIKQFFQTHCLKCWKLFIGLSIGIWLLFVIRISVLLFSYLYHQCFNLPTFLLFLYVLH